MQPKQLSPRVIAALAAAMLAVGVAVGAAIGPAPSASFAGASRLRLLLPSLLAGAGGGSTTAAVQPPPATPQATPSAAGESSATAPAPSAPASTSATTTPTGTSETSTPSATTPANSSPAKATLPPVTHVWLIELAGSSFAEAAAQPAAAPYIDSQAVPAGTLLSGWSGLAGSAFASDTALLESTPPQLLDTIVQPPCPEGAGAQCVAGTPGGLTAADEFLKATVPTITANAAYRESGLIVVTFATVASATATGLPAGASTATLTAQPPAGVLLISPFVSAGTRSSSAFDPTSPKRSLEKLLRQ